VPCDTQVWPLAEADGQTRRPQPPTGVPPQTAARQGPVPRRPRLHPASAAQVRVAAIAQQWPAGAGQRSRLLEGANGPLVADLLALRVVSGRDQLPGPEVGVVIRRTVSGPTALPAWKSSLSNAPPQTPLEAFARVSGMRWPIETCFEDAKGDVGMDQYALRFWRGWHHQMTLVLLAQHCLVRWQRRLAQRDPSEGAVEHQPDTGPADPRSPRPGDTSAADRLARGSSASPARGRLATTEAR
jgi:hypothetical protein